MIEKNREERVREIVRLAQEGCTHEEIGKQLGIHRVTVTRYLKKVNDRYLKQIAKNPKYLEKTADRMYEYLKKYDHVIKSLYAIVNRAEKHRTDIEYMINLYYPKLESEGKEEITRDEANEITKIQTARKLFGSQLKSIARTNATVERGVYTDVKGVLDSQAKILKILAGAQNYQQINYNLYMDEVKIVFNVVKNIIETYIPTEENKRKAYEKLANIQNQESKKP